MNDFELTLKRIEIENADDYKGWIGKIPFIEFPRDWRVQIIPPFGGAIVRFRVKLPNSNTKSVYLDGYDRLGCYGEPYWEVYPVGDDVGRCDMNDIKTLLQLIEE